MNQTILERIHVLVSGKVQGVGFRYSVLRTADSLGLKGWVRNLPDGRVELIAEGKQKSVTELLDWCRRGPSNAQVLDVTVQERIEIKDSEFNCFNIT